MEPSFKVKGDWTELKAKLKSMYPTLTETDLSFTTGKEELLMSRLQKKLGMSREEVVDAVEDLQAIPVSESTKKY
jgi:uncharacterized protein YjbJ (UPF0337 family)